MYKVCPERQKKVLWSTGSPSRSLSGGHIGKFEAGSTSDHEAGGSQAKG